MLICDQFLPGSLLRGAQPELMEDLIHSLKNGDESRIQALLSEVADKSMPIEDEEVGELPHEEEVANILIFSI